MLVKKQYVTAALILALLCAFASVLSGCGHLTELIAKRPALFQKKRLWKVTTGSPRRRQRRSWRVESPMFFWMCAARLSTI